MVSAGIPLTSPKMLNVILSEFLSFWVFSPCPTLLCGRIFLGAKSPQEIFPLIPARKNYAQEAHFFGSSRWTLSFPNFDLVPCAFGAFDGAIWSQFSRFMWNRLSQVTILRHTTQLRRLLQYRNWSFRTTFLRLLVGLSFSLNKSEMAFVAIYTTFFWFVIQIHGRTTESTWRIFTELESAWNFILVFRVFLFIAWSLWGFVFLAVSMVLPSHGRREKTIALFVSDLRPSFHWRVGHDWNYMNLLWSIVHVPSIENTLSLSSHRRLCFLFWLSVTDPRSTTSFRILKFQFLIIWSLWKFAPVFICWWFRSPLFRATSWSNKAITIWSWTEFCDFDLYNPSRIDSEDISPTVKSAWSHRTSKSRTSSSFCKLVANNFASPCTASKAPVARKNSKIMYAISLPRKNWSELSAAALRHFLLFGSLTACRDASSRLTQSSHEANRNQEN